MRKVLGLLVAAVFVASVASVALAQIDSSATFRAEISFDSTNTTFGFTLKKVAAGNALPTPASDSAVQTIEWADPFEKIAAGSGDSSGLNDNDPDSIPKQRIVVSKVYGELAFEGLQNGTSVQMYTENERSAQNPLADNEYRFDANVSTWNIGALAPLQKSTQTVDLPALPLIYRIVDTSTNVITKVTGSSEIAEVPYVSISSMNQVSLYENVWYPAQNQVGTNYGQFYVEDKADQNGTDAYKTIADHNGIRVGFGATAGEVHYKEGPVSGNGNLLMFFGTNGYEARKGTKYGTDRLTVEIVAE